MIGIVSKRILGKDSLMTIFSRSHLAPSRNKPWETEKDSLLMFTGDVLRRLEADCVSERVNLFWVSLRRFYLGLKFGQDEFKSNSYLIQKEIY